MIEVSVGTNSRNAKNLRTLTLPGLGEFAEFVRQHTSHISALAPDVDTTLAGWRALPKKLRDKIKTRGHYLIAGLTRNGTRNTEAVTAAGLLAIDIDAQSLSHLEVAQMVSRWAAVYFETANSTAGARRWRICLPLARQVPQGEFPGRAKEFGKVHGLPLDACSYKVAQPQMLPIAFDDYAPTVHVNEGSLLDLFDYADHKDLAVTGPKDGRELADLANYRPPVEHVSREQLAAAMSRASPEDYETWLKVGMVCHHQYDGDTEGLELWEEWSAQCPDKYAPGVCEAKWKTFRTPAGRRPVTARSILGSTAVNGAESLKRREGFQRRIEHCNDEVALRDIICKDVAADSKVGDYDREQIAQVVRQRLHDLARASLGGAAARPIAIRDARKLVDPKRAKHEAGEQESAPPWLEPWVYVQNGDHFMHKVSGRTCSSQGFNAEFRRELIHNGVTEMSAVQLALYGPDPIPVVQHPMYWPGMSPVFQDQSTGIYYVNTWKRNTAPTPCYYETWNAEDFKVVKAWLRLFVIMFPARRERRLLWSWLCFVAQNPGKRINWAPVIQGPQGVGKTLISELLRAALGATNVATVGAHTISQPFTHWGEGHMLKVMEEIRLPGERGGTAHAVINAMKPYITNERVEVHRKGKDPYEIPNVTNYLLLTNHEDAIPLEASDRRFYVLFTRPRSEADVLKITARWPDLYRTVGESKKTHKSVLRGMLLHYSKFWTEFDPYGRAPNTPHKKIMRNYSMPADEFALDEALNGIEEGVNGKGGVLSTAHLRDLIRRETGREIRTSRFGMLLRQRGWEKFTGGGGKLRWRGRGVNAWVRIDTGLNAPQASETLRRLLDETIDVSGFEERTA